LHALIEIIYFVFSNQHSHIETKKRKRNILQFTNKRTRWNNMKMYEETESERGRTIL